jgi:hypothetical protein
MRKIYCYTCKEFLGEIRDATLRKDIKYQCGKCATPKKQESHDLPERFAEIRDSQIAHVRKVVV